LHGFWRCPESSRIHVEKLVTKDLSAALDGCRTVCKAPEDYGGCTEELLLVPLVLFCLE